MKTHLLTTLLLAGLAASASAQEPNERRGGRERRGGGPRGPGRMMDRVVEDLGLDDAQRELWDEITAGNLSQMDEWRGQMRELRQARRDGDEARATELQEQMEGNAWNPMDAVQESLEQLEPALGADQLEQLSGIKERLQERREAFAARGADGGRRGGPRGPGRMAERVAESLELSDEQRAEFDQIVDGHRERMQEARPLGREMWEAQRAGDTQRAEELRAQMRELGADPRESLNQAMNEVDTILDDQQAERFSEMRQNMAQWNERREFFRQAESEIPNALNLDEEQRAQYDGFLRDQRRGMRAQWEQRRTLQREMREARAAGDEARLEELQLELEMYQADPAGAQAEFLDGVSGMLREEQVPMLKGFYPTVVVGPAARSDDVRDILRAALRAGLDQAQRDKWRVIMRGAMKATHEIRKKDKEAESAIAAETRKKIEALLTEAQLTRFEKELKRLRRSGRKIP